MNIDDYGDTDITLNGKPADYYAHGDRQIIVIPKDLGNYNKDDRETPDMLLVTEAHFKHTILKRNGKF